MGVRAAVPDDAKSVTRNVRNLPVSAPIRTKYMYCNLMYTVATYLVEKKSGCSFADFLQIHFFRPLDMTRSFLQAQAARKAGFGSLIAVGHHWQKRPKSYLQFDAQIALTVKVLDPSSRARMTTSSGSRL